MRRWLITTVVTAVAGFIANRLSDRAESRGRGPQGRRSRGRRR
ncbi:hypothetical protein OVA14_10725 [Agrococcus sp. SL85]|nr:hypothetical protein [Agrococcus sp. SL85]WAC65787.1 hypothetical protein OVA14_10725 [Agrococcus sp. SL85]